MILEWVKMVAWAEFANVGLILVAVSIYGLIRSLSAPKPPGTLSTTGGRIMFDPTTVRKNRTTEIEIRPICGYLTNDETLNHGEKCTQVAEIRFKWRDGFLYNCEFHAACLAVGIIEKIERETNS